MKDFQPIDTLKKGDYFRRKEVSKKTHVRGSYIHSRKAYECYDFDDVNSFIYLKKGKEVFVNFEF